MRTLEDGDDVHRFGVNFASVTAKFGLRHGRANNPSRAGGLKANRQRRLQRGREKGLHEDASFSYI